MDALLSVHIRFQNLSNQIVDYVNDKACIEGQRFQHIVMNSSSNVRYCLQILARLPLLLAIHFWYLLGTYSENNIWILINLIVVYAMARSWMFNDKTLVPYYILIYLELCVAAAEESFYWTIQNETGELCHISRVITWGDGDGSWRLPAIGFIVIEAIYFWVHVYYTRTLHNLLHLKLYCFVFTIFLIPTVLPIFGVLPNALSTIGYILNKIRLAVLLFTKTLDIEDSDKKYDIISLNDEVIKYHKHEDGAKSKAEQRILHLQQRVNMNRDERHIFNNFASHSGVKNIFYIFGFLYFGTACILEIVWYDNNNASDSVFLNVCRFLLRWSTSLVPVFVISFSFNFIDRILTGLSVWLVSWEITFMDAMNIRIDDKLVHLTFLTLLIETDISSSSTDLDLKTVIIIVFISYCFIVQKTVNIVGENIMAICNRSPQLEMWFYFRVCVTFLILLIIPVAMLALVISEEVWLVFFASGSIVIISSTMFVMIEWGLIFLTWYMNQFEHVIQYIQIAKELSYIVLLPIQFYARYTLSVFRAWWILRAGNLIFNYIVLVVVLISQRIKMYDHNKHMLLLLNNLSDVSYAPLHEGDHDDYTCSICFSSMRDGKELACKHVFHKECLRRWFKVRTVCPTCNLALT